MTNSKQQLSAENQHLRAENRRLRAEVKHLRFWCAAIEEKVDVFEEEIEEVEDLLALAVPTIRKLLHAIHTPIVGIARHRVIADARKILHDMGVSDLYSIQ